MNYIKLFTPYIIPIVVVILVKLLFIRKVLFKYLIIEHRVIMESIFWLLFIQLLVWM